MVLTFTVQTYSRRNLILVLLIKVENPLDAEVNAMGELYQNLLGAVLGSF